MTQQLPSQIGLSVNGPDTDKSFEMNDESSLIIGSSDACKIRLEHDSISPKHCLLRFSSGALIVQDWFSATGTFVDGVKAEEEFRAESDCLLTVGEYSIQVKFKSIAKSTVEEIQEPKLHRVQHENSTDAASNEDMLVEATPADNLARSNPIDAPTSEPQKLPTKTLEPQTLEPQGQRKETRLAPKIRTEESEQIEFLLQEVEMLQSEMAMRDAQLAELELQSSDFSCEEVDAADDDSSDRFNELLDELARGDQRTRALEDLLLISEEATAAEREERLQIDAWISDLESRISEREAEWQAEIEVLNERNQGLHQSIQEMEVRSQQIASEAGLETQETAIRELRHENEHVKKQLETSESQISELQEKLDAISENGSLIRQQELVEQALREEHINIARERAEASRQKAELLRRVSDLEQQLLERRVPNEADQKFQAFREHLREIHEHEKNEPKKAKPITQRLKELWQRLDGPTDTD